jgi:hypothetical protein
MPVFGRFNLVAIAFSLALHAGVFMLTSSIQFSNLSKPKQPPKEQIVLLQILPAPPKAVPPQVQESSVKIKPLTNKSQSSTLSADTPVISPTSSKQLASMAPPPPPTAEEWAFAGSYTNKNSKGYRYNWGQQVRSMMGTVVEGPDQGYVRFRIEIAPDGTLAKLETIWTTSAVAEQLARKAVENMPSLPPTPTGKLLIFEKTISFTPFASDDPPSYRDDCLPDPTVFRNPFAWDGKSPQVRSEPPKAEKLSPQAMEECLRQLPKDSVEAEMARDRREMERWGWNK